MCVCVCVCESLKNRICDRQETQAFIEQERLIKERLKKEILIQEQKDLQHIEAHMQVGEENEDWEDNARRAYLRQLMEENKKVSQER